MKKEEDKLLQSTCIQMITETIRPYSSKNHFQYREIFLIVVEDIHHEETIFCCSVFISCYCICLVILYLLLCNALSLLIEISFLQTN